MKQILQITGKLSFDKKNIFITKNGKFYTNKDFFNKVNILDYLIVDNNNIKGMIKESDFKQKLSNNAEA